MGFIEWLIQVSYQVPPNSASYINSECRIVHLDVFQINKTPVLCETFTYDPPHVNYMHRLLPYQKPYL